ncbi:ABC transporter ATP-binding protein [Chitinispirillales bacterium ANBcel5]|uniref:ABC transporter ATP-binding protein n=1 Tax=Cellulosispirillum alkaliphilum TaxID=3039283 RepID=UPI002A4E4FFA|nr:ABC transporter ATP-binding protein [Chitinispirillales bacterium ANBcel5]
MLENSGKTLRREDLPEELRAALNGKSNSIIYYQASDLTSKRTFGRSYLALTDSSLIVVCQGKTRKEYPLNSIEDIGIDELVGGGRLTAKTSAGVHHLLYYSNHMVPHFSTAARFIMNLKERGRSEEPESQPDSFCQNCSSPLPARDSKCPRCVPRLKILFRIFSLASPYKSKAIALMIVTAMGVLFQALPPFITKLIVDDVVGDGQTERLVPYTVAMISAGLFYLILRLINIRLTSWISARIVSDLRSRLHSVLQYLKMNFFMKREPGEIAGRVMHDTGELQQFLIEGMPYILINSLSFIVVGAILISINWMLALLIFIPVPFLVLGSQWFWKKLHPLFLRQGTAIGHMHSVLGESFQGLRVIKAFSQEKKRIEMFDTVNKRLAATEMKTFRTFGSFSEVMFAIMSLGVALVWYFAVRMINSSVPAMTLGDLLAFVGYIWLFYGPLQWFSVIMNWMTHAFSGAERIFEIIDSSPESHDEKNVVELPKIHGRIEFRDVHFSYERGKEVIKGVSLDIKQGEVIGLVGKSGAGKSTIINLLSRFFEPDSGQILIDGVPIDHINLTQLRKNMGIVLQDPFLFNASIAENIAYGLDHVSFAEIVEAARAAYAHDFIIRKPDGYDTLIGDRAVSLSGGERQRIAIARAVLHNPPILILDEATSAVDASTEKHIQEAIGRLVKGRTTIAIAHRLSTLRIADRLVVVDNGKIAETGTHDQLIRTGGIYADLAKSYTKMNSLQSVVWGG